MSIIRLTLALICLALVSTVAILPESFRTRAESSTVSSRKTLIPIHSAPAVIELGTGKKSLVRAGNLREFTTGSVVETNSPPIAVDDSYAVHGGTQLGNLLVNDSDPDGDGIIFGSYGTLPQHGGLYGPNLSMPSYAPENGFVGTDSFTYRICDTNSTCSNYATVTLNITNAPPVAVNETFSVHGGTQLGDLLANDYDPEGDGFIFNAYGNLPQNGGLYGPNLSIPSYAPANGFVGTDSFTYRICDTLGACSSYATVTLNVTNNAPTSGADFFVVLGQTELGDLLVNDSDPDGDGIVFNSIQTLPQHGQLQNPNLQLPAYAPNVGFTGTDSFTYRVCDTLSSCTDVTVTLYVIGDGSDDGAASCNANIGKPINVTNGNMYLHQADHSLPGVGPAISITRTYNSNSQLTGLFGKGWATAYDQSILAIDNNLLRLNAPDGRATYFGRAVGSTGAFMPLQGDFHGQLTHNGDGSFTLSLSDGSARQFNTAGKLLSLADRNNNTTALTYGGNGFLSSITDPFGRILTVTPNGNGQVLSLSDTMGTIASYGYGGGNQLLSVTYADSSGFQFTYDGNNRLTNVTDVLGNIVESHTYDGQGRAITSARHGGVEQYTLSYVSATQTDVTDALGHITKYTIDKSKGRNVVTSVEGMCSCGGGQGSQVQSWTYDSQLNVESKTDGRNHSTTYTYDNNGNPLTETNWLGTAHYTYNQFSQVLTATDRMEGVTTNTYDAAGNLLVSEDALHNPTTFTYNSRGQVLTITDARTKKTTLTYDAGGNLAQIKDANNLSSFYFYDARGRRTRTQDPLGRSTLYDYDLAGRLNKITHPDNSFVTFTYDLAGRRTIVTDERNNPTHYAYDAAYRLTSTTDAAGQITSYGYDAMSNLTSTTDALLRVTNYEYDDFNRLVKTIYPPAVTGGTRLFETLAYDAAGNVTERVDTAQRSTSYVYDDVNRVATSTDADDKTTTFEYDALSRVTGVLDALTQHYQFAYDAMGRQTQATRGGVSMSYGYDAVGNRIQRTDYNGLVTNYAYDNLNRLTTITYPTRTQTYGYTMMSKTSRATNGNGSVYIGYDTRYRIQNVTNVYNYVVNYVYDTAGNRTQLKLNGAPYANYTYDAVNRLTNLADSANQNFPHSYDVANRLTSRGAPNGVTTSFAHDGLDSLTGLTHTAGATTLISNQYQYNDASNISNWANASGNHAYGYDPVNRLTATTNSAQPNENYAYDVVGNRTASHLSASYNYQPFNKLTSTATATYTYDNNGNMTSKTDASGPTTFSWNEENQLKQVTLPSGLTVDYKYDALGRRIQRTTSAGANERYVYDGQDVLLDLNADWSVAATYLNGPGIDNHLRQTSATTGVSYFLGDHLGSTAGLTDGSGNVVEQLSYDSFGNSVGSARTRYGYTGRERDPDTGLMHYRAREYDPQLGRFVSEDPIGFLGRDVNFYAYVKNSSLLYRDPSGLQRCDPIVGAILGAGAGGVVGIVGGALLGPPVGAAIGAAIGGLGLGAVGTVVEPGGGTLVGGGLGAGGGGAAGAVGGAAAGPFVGGAIGAGIGAYIGYRICSGGEEACDSTPPAVPIPMPTPGPIPILPPPINPNRNPKKEEECYQRCQHLLPSPSGDLQSSEFRKCYRECMGTL